MELKIFQKLLKTSFTTNLKRKKISMMFTFMW